jgi:hypothetical protein
MNPRPFSSIVALFLIALLIVPSAFLVAPQRANALFGIGDIVFDPTNLVQTTVSAVENTITAIKSTLSAALDVTNTAANVATQINAYVLQPLAFVLSGNLLKMITAGVISFVIGKANGTGIPQFVTDVQKSLQTVGDARALSFFNQFGRNSNSPFAASISSSLRNNYLSKTSLAGFWAANMNTLARSTPSYRPGYLAGNWSQGGVAAWFALTTQTQNNPYTFYPIAQEQLATLVGPGGGGATGARVAELNWGQGFTSWCGASEGSTTADNDGTEMESEAGINPGDPCTDKEGNPGITKTPGSVIVASLNKALGSQTDSILRMGNVGPEINGILRNIGTVMQTVNFATEILGGASSGGLFGVNSTSGTNSTSRLMQYQNTPGYLGTTNSSILKNAATLPVSGPEMLSRVTQYESAWSTINTAANAASTTIASLADFCTAAAMTESNTASFVSESTAQATAARTALTDVIAPILAQVAAAAEINAAARAMVQRIQTALNSSLDSTGSTYATDLQTLQSMSPTAADVANIQQETQAFNMAAASPEGSLNVSGGSIIDRMSLISTNAVELKTSVCTPRSRDNSSGD